jgi:hypothetical protein
MYIVWMVLDIVGKQQFVNIAQQMGVGEYELN